MNKCVFAVGQLLLNDYNVRQGQLGLTVAGPYLLSISLAGQPIVGSPFGLTVRPAAVDASQCTAEGEACQQGMNDCRQSFTVIGRDTYQNRCVEGGALLRAILTPVNSTAYATSPATPQNMVAEPHVDDNADGTYTVEYSVHDTGMYSALSPFPQSPEC